LKGNAQEAAMTNEELEAQKAIVQAAFDNAEPY